jgi:CelD/BcsL family acetyltransferase involved in cellulose biosynthesis
LRVGEVDVASCYMQIRGAVAYAWKINFDEAYGRASPGTVVFHEAIMDALRSGATRVEFMAATFQTARAATHTHRTARDVLALPTWRGDVMNAVLRLSTRWSGRHHGRAASPPSSGEA